MNYEEIRVSVDKILSDIEELQNKLIIIRANCNHDILEDGLIMDSIITDCKICTICGESFPY